MTIASTNAAAVAVEAATPRRYPELAGKTVVVTGGASGIGLATARAFAAQGCRIALLDLDERRLDWAAADVAAAGVEVMPRVLSVSDAAAVELAFSATTDRFGGVDVLFASAGIAMNRPTLELTAPEWQRAVDVNLTGVFLCDQAAARRMVPRRSGVILNVASMYGIAAAAQRAAYCATKAAVVNLTRALADEWGSLGLRVNALAPGYVHTDLVETLVREGRLDVNAIEQRTPARRLARPEEIAALAVFLASSDAAFVQGHSLVADGGWTAHGGI
jgi:NAD(P)-dependent dehydrogenase (short-subunit alcohol dehydrogenase family)